MRNYVIGLDQGTTGTFAALMNPEGEFVGSAYQSHRQFYFQPGWVEQDPNELWRNACQLLNQIMAEGRVRAEEIAGIGIANQGESVVLWDRQTGDPLYPVLVWQDTRTQREVERLAVDPELSREVAQRTGLRLDSYFSASKIRWLLDHLSVSQNLLLAGRLACGTLDTWLIWKLTEGRAFVTDVSTASRTLLFNIHTLQWDEWLLRLFDIPLEILAEVMESTGEFGQVSDPNLTCRGVPIVTSLVDQPAAMAGQGCLSAGQLKATYGTGCFVNLNTGSDLVISQHGLLTMLAWQRDGNLNYGLDGGVLTAAASLNWCREKFSGFSGSEDIDNLCGHVSDSSGVIWIPAQTGLGAPYWNRAVRGAWLGIGLGTTESHLILAILEGIAARATQIVEAMQRDTGLSISQLQADGGLTNSRVMMQTQANLLGKPVKVLANSEATTSGVCGLAARASGLWNSDDLIRNQVRIARTYEPAISEDERLSFLDRFGRAVRHLEAWHNND